MSTLYILALVWAVGIALVGPAFSKVSQAQDVTGVVTLVGVLLWPLVLIYGFLKFGYGKAEVVKK